MIVERAVYWAGQKKISWYTIYCFSTIDGLPNFCSFSVILRTQYPLSYYFVNIYIFCTNTNLLSLVKMVYTVDSIYLLIGATVRVDQGQM